MNTVHRFTAKVGEHEIIVETGLLAQQAGGAVTVRCGDTMILATATASKEPREGVDFFPLTVDYEERLYAAGRIPGGFFKREGKPSEEAILLCRLTDRPLRPLFPKGFRNDVQIIVTALSADQENYLDILSIIGASAALTISDIPFQGPVGAVRVGYIDGRFVFNPTASEMANSEMDLRLAGTADAVLMVEAGADEVPESLMLEAIRLGHEAMQDVIRMQNEMAAAIGKPKREFTLHVVPEETRQWTLEQIGDRIQQILTAGLSKEERNTAIDNLAAELVEKAGEQFVASDVKEVFEETLRAAMRAQVLDKGIRVDGRGLRDIRPISCQVGLLPRAHGSGLFTRGETQVLTIATLGTSADEQILDTVATVGAKRYMHHYNFPPYSTGEVKPLRGPGRREIGHGALAERALVPVIPSQEQFPYTIRLVSEVLSSNGSTSMASVCGSTLALMDTGVPIKAPVAGVAMGLIKEGDRYAVLTDILGMEDHLGDMDFKVAGTREGVTALQMDMKVKGLDYNILEQALQQAHEARMYILDKMLEVIDKPRATLSPFAPRIVMVKIPQEKIGTLIGPGGKTIRSIQEQTGAKIDVEEDGTVYISALEGPGGMEAERMVRALTEEATIGKIYTGKVVRITDFGAFVEILPGTDGLVHISQLADYRVPSVEDVVKVGDEIMVMVIDIDKDGKIKLSRQAVLEGWTAEEARARDRKPSGPRPGGDRPRSGGDRRGGGRPPQRR
ncbi:MAG: polyribonucleotide nucleotidyltransferase [Anaerolineae bacterium]|nr:polyribonucleotide nucleotidyltransferase [Anaerolineae bacterium]